MLADVLIPFRGSPDFVCVVDARGEIVACNQATPGLFAEATDAIQDVLRTGAPREIEWSLPVADGERRWFAAAIWKVEVAGEVGAIVSARDVSALKQRLRRSEQLMVDTQGTAHLGIWEWEITQPHVVWSAELYRIYGLAPETYTPTYAAYLERVHPDDRQRVADATDRVFHEHVPYSHDERIYRPDGSIRHLHTWAHPVLDETGALRSLIGVCQDITDRVIAEEAVHRLNAELEQRVAQRTQQLETALGDLETFNAMVSHDLRAPLAVIQTAVELIGEDLPPTAAPFVERIDRSVTNMSRLISELLAFARAGHAALQPAEVDVSALCLELAAEQRQTAGERTCTVEPGIRLRVDPTLFRAALGNLIGNAWKYTARTASPRIEIGLRCEGELYIRDNGIGFDMKHHDALFQPFKRLANATDFKGTGVGLATTARVIERHGGAIRAESTLGAGATFVLTFPAETWVG